MNNRNTNPYRAKARNLKLISFSNLFLSSFLILSLLFAFTSNLEAQSVKDKISGKLVDAETGDPLIGANVVIQGTNMGAASDLEGNYLILGVPPGNYTPLVMMMGYARVTVNYVVVTAGEVTKINASLKKEERKPDGKIPTEDLLPSVNFIYKDFKNPIERQFFYSINQKYSIKSIRQEFARTGI